MPKRYLSLFLPLAAMLLFGLSPCATLAQELSVAGFVATDEGEPIEDATVSLLKALRAAEIAERFEAGEATEEVLATASTDAKGFYRLAAPDIGVYWVLVEAPDRLPAMHALSPLLESQTMQKARLAPARRVDIKVEDAAGQALEGARVVLNSEPAADRRRRRSRRSSWVPKRQRAVTDETGQVTLIAGHDEKIKITVLAEGKAPEFLDRSADLASTFTVTLDAGQSRTIRVFDADDKPAADVLVRSGQHMPIARSDEQGRLVVRLSGEPLNLVATIGEGLDEQRGDLRIEVPDPADRNPGQEPEELALQLEFPPLVSGRVVDSERRPIAGALVWPGRRVELAGRTDDRGNYTVPAGESWVIAAALGFRRNHAAIDEKAEQGPTVVLEPAASLSGRVVNELGEAISDAEITARTPGRRGRFRPAGESVTLPDGRFHLGGLVVDTGLSLQVRARGYITDESTTEPLSAGEARTGVEIQLKPALAAVGRVVDEQEQPVVGAQVDLAPQPASADLRTLMRQMRDEQEPKSATTGEDGRFRIDDLDPDTYRLTATAGGFAPAKVPGLELEEGAGEVDLGTVVVVPGIELEGRVTDPNGRSLAGVQVKATPGGSGMAARLAGMGEDPIETSTDAEGRFVLRDLLPEQVLSIALEKEQWAAESQEVVASIDANAVTLVMHPAARLVVEVRDAASNPVENATVMARRTSGSFAIRPLSSRSTSSGTAEIDQMVPGRYDIEVTLDGFRPFSRSGVEVGAGDETLRVVLERGQRVSGRVLDASGNPVNEAFVRVEDSSSNPFSFSRQFGRSDGDGRFTIEGLEPGPRDLVVRHEDLGETRKRIEVAEGMAEVEVRFSGGARVSGQVVDGAGAPVAGASAVLSSGASRNPFGARGLNATSETDGRFVIENVPPGNYTLVVAHEDFANASTDPFDVEQLPISGLVVEMGSGEAIVGRVIGLEFDQLANTSIMAMSPSGGFLASTVDYEGRFRIERISPGDWILQATTEGGGQARETVLVEAGDGEVEVEIEFGGGLQVRGTVMRSGSPVTGVTVRVSHADRLAFGDGRTDNDGRFTIEGLEPGSYTATVQKTTGEVLHREEKQLQGDDEWFFDLRASAVAGRVLGSDGQGLSGVSVSLGPPGQSTSRANSAIVTSDSFGQFDFGEIAAGTYRLIANKSGYAQFEQELEVAASPLRDLELRLERSAGVTVRPQRADGAALSRIQIAVLRPGAADTGSDSGDGARAGVSLIESGSRTLDESGLLTLDSLPAGDFVLLIAEGGGPTVELPIRSPGDAGVVPLPRGGALRLEMPDLFADGIRVEVDILAPNGPYRAIEDFTGAWNSWLRGSELRRVLPAGSYTVVVKASDDRRWELPATIIEGSETTLRVP